MTDNTKQQSNPYSTGGGGVIFETRVQAAFAVFMLTGGIVPCLPSWPISRIKLQGKYAGFETDDCIVFVQDPNTKKEVKLFAQIRHSISITESDQLLSEVILAAWKDFNNPNLFSEDTDCIALIAGLLSSMDIKHVRPILEWARHCADSYEFISKINAPGFSSDTKKEKLQVFKTHLRKANNDKDLSDEMLWRFLKIFHIIGYDLDSESSSTLSLLKSLIQMSSKEQDPDAVWANILSDVQSANYNAGTITLSTIPESIRSCFTISSDHNWESDRKKLSEHGDYILSGIRTEIGGVHIDRPDVFCQLIDISESSSFVLLSGGQGCGKSAIVREFAQFAEKHYPIFCLRTEDINESHIDKVFTSIGMQSSLSTLAACFALMPKKYLLLESLEKLLEFRYNGAFIDLIIFLKRSPGWTVIASARDYAYQQITLHYLQPYGISWTPLTIPEFGSADIDYLCSKIEKLKPLADNTSTKALLMSPFLADLAVRVIETGTKFTTHDNERTFREAVWRDYICKENERAEGLPIKRKQAFISIAINRAKQMSYGVSAKAFDSEIILKLEADSLIRRDPHKGLVSPANDVLEDWALEAFIEEAFQQKSGNLPNFLNALGMEPAMGRAFRLWLQNRLKFEQVSGQTRSIILEILKYTEIQDNWKDETISAALMGDSPIEFLNSLRDQLFENKGELLKRFLFILRISCKAPDQNFIRQMAGEDEKLSRAVESFFLVPYGKGWEAAILFLYENIHNIGIELLPYLTPLLYEWSALISIEKSLPPLAHEAGLLVLHLLEMVKESYRDEGDRKKLLEVIIKVVPQIESEFISLLEKDVFRKNEIDSGNRRPGYVHELLPMVLVDFNTDFLCKHSPDIVIKLAWQEWLIDDSNEKRSRRYSLDIGACFGLNEHRKWADFFPASGAKGPFSHLLRFHPEKGLEFIIELCNLTAEKYAHSTLDLPEREMLFPPDPYELPRQVETKLSDGTIIKQYGSFRLWASYRSNIVVSPRLLQSALMALENWLITIIEQTNNASHLEQLIDYILRNSNSVMTTAIIASVATGFPKKIGKASFPLLRVPEFYHWDMSRYINECGGLEPNWFGGLKQDPKQNFYAEERRRAALRPWRKEHLETLVCRLQFTELRDEVFKIIDDLHANIPKSNQKEEGHIDMRFLLHRIDIRGWEPKADQVNNRITFLTKNVEPELQEIQDQTQGECDIANRFIALFLWSDKTFKGESLEREYYANWKEAFLEAKNLLELLKSDDVNEFVRMQSGGIIKAAALFLRDHSSELNNKDFEWCTNLVIEAVLANADTENAFTKADRSDFNGAATSAQVLPIFLDYLEKERMAKTLIATAITHANENVRTSAAIGIREHLWQRAPKFAQACIEGAIEYARLKLKEVKKRRNSQYWQNLEKQKESIESYVSSDWLSSLRGKIAAAEVKADLNNIDFNSHSSWYLLSPFLMIPNGSTRPEHISFSSRMLLLLLKEEEHRNQHRHGKEKHIGLPEGFINDFCMRFADYLLSLPEYHKQNFVDILRQKIETAPSFITFFMICLLSSAEKIGSYELYWNIWRLLSDRIQEIAIQLCEREICYDDLSRLIQRVLFSNISRNQLKPEEKLLIPGIDAILAFINNAGRNPIVFEAMSCLLFYFHDLFMPKGFMILASHQKSIGGTFLLSGINTVFYLERVLQQLIVLKPTEYAILEDMREASLIILNAMIETGSSSAYFLRDYLLHSGYNR